MKPRINTTFIDVPAFPSRYILPLYEFLPSFLWPLSRRKSTRNSAFLNRFLVHIFIFHSLKAFPVDNVVMMVIGWEYPERQSDC